MFRSLAETEETGRQRAMGSLLAVRAVTPPGHPEQTALTLGTVMTTWAQAVAVAEVLPLQAIPELVVMVALRAVPVEAVVQVSTAIILERVDSAVAEKLE
jgi:hypothetical protein